MKRLIVIMAVFFLLSGCATYYRVSDPATDNVYYTRSVTRRSSGAVIFKDSRSGKEVTLQSSEIKEVSKEEYSYGGTKE